MVCSPRPVPSRAHRVRVGSSTALGPCRHRNNRYSLPFDPRRIAGRRERARRSVVAACIQDIRGRRRRGIGRCSARVVARTWRFSSTRTANAAMRVPIVNMRRRRSARAAPSSRIAERTRSRIRRRGVPGAGCPKTSGCPCCGGQRSVHPPPAGNHTYRQLTTASDGTSLVRNRCGGHRGTPRPVSCVPRRTGSEIMLHLKAPSPRQLARPSLAPTADKKPLAPDQHRMRTRRIIPAGPGAFEYALSEWNSPPPDSVTSIRTTRSTASSRENYLSRSTATR